MFLSHLELGHTHVATHAEHYAESETSKQGNGVTRAKAGTFCAHVLV